MRVLVVGAGVAGLALGRVLARAGIGVEVVERARAWTPGAGAGIYLPANGVRALRELGLGDALVARGRGNRRRRYLTAGGATNFEVDLAAFWGDVGEDLGVSRAALHDVLLGGADGVPLRMGRIPAVVKDDGRGVGVVFDDGEEARYDLVVGADGLHSATRARLEGEARVPHRLITGASWRFLAPLPAGVDCWTLFGGPRALALIVPIGQDRAYCWAAEIGAPRTAEPPPTARLRAALDGFAPPVAAVLDAADGAWFAPIEEVGTVSWGRGRVLLIGDAAHGMAPAMAQGGALAVEDALALAGLLTVPGADPAGVAERLRERRQARVAGVRSHTARQTRLLTLPAALRTAAVRLTGARLWERSFAPLRVPW